MNLIGRFPALCVAACMTVGILLGSILPSGAIELLWLIGAILTLVVVLTFMRGERFLSLQPLVRSCCLFGAAVAFSATLVQMQAHLPENHVAHLVGETHHVSEETYVRVFGQISTTPHTTERQIRLTLNLDSLQVDDTIHPTTGSIQVVHWKQETSGELFLHRGDVVAIVGELLPPPRPRNPADMDYGAYLERRGIYAQILVDDLQAVHLLGEQLTVAEHTIEEIRGFINRSIDRHLPHESAKDVLRALLLGDRSGIDADRREQFVQTGLMHLLAVSGLHVLLVGFVLYQLLQPFLLRIGFSWRWTEVGRATVTMVVLIIYMLITEMRPSVVRATVMAGLFIGSSLLQRPTNSLNTLGVAALILLLIRPSQLFDVGFQLSFSAVGAILLLNPKLQGWMREYTDAWWTYFATIGTTTIAATIGTLPVLLGHFGFASFAGLILNLLAIPATALGLAGGLLMVLVAGISWEAASILGVASDVFLRALLEIASTGAAWFSWAAIETSLTLMSALILIALLSAGTWWQFVRWRWGCVMFASGLAVLSVWTNALSQDPTLDIEFLDVGQANAALVHLPDGGHALFDAGLYNPYVDSGERTILPHLLERGVKRLNAVVISHPHSDHLGGLASILQSVPVDTVYSNGYAMDSEIYTRTQSLIDSLPVTERVLRKGDMIPLGSSVHAKVLYPTDEAVTENNVNDGSVVVRLSYGATSFLFLGDAEHQSEGDMYEWFPEFLSADVIQVGHHGSRTSSTRLFLQKALSDTSRVTHAVISAGARNRYGHPSSEVKGKWASKNAKIHWTAVSGAIFFQSDGKSVRPINWR